jgi:hypothetical protein
MKVQLYRVKSMETSLTPLRRSPNDFPLGVCRDLVIHTETGDATIQLFGPTIDELMLPPNDPSLAAALQHARVWNAHFAKALARIATLPAQSNAVAAIGIAVDILGNDLEEWINEIEEAAA